MQRSYSNQRFERRKERRRGTESKRERVRANIAAAQRVTYLSQTSCCAKILLKRFDHVVAWTQECAACAWECFGVGGGAVATVLFILLVMRERRTTVAGHGCCQTSDARPLKYWTMYPSFITRGCRRVMVPHGRPCHAYSCV